MRTTWTEENDSRGVLSLETRLLDAQREWGLAWRPPGNKTALWGSRAKCGSAPFTAIAPLAFESSAEKKGHQAQLELGTRASSRLPFLRPSHPVGTMSIRPAEYRWNLPLPSASTFLGSDPGISYLVHDESRLAHFPTVALCRRLPPCWGQRGEVPQCQPALSWQVT